MYERDEDSPRETPMARAARLREYQQSLMSQSENEITKRCETGDGDAFNMDCLWCGAPLGGVCQDR